MPIQKPVGAGLLESMSTVKSNFFLGTIFFVLLIIGLIGYLMNRGGMQDSKNFICHMMVHEVTYSENVQTRVRFKAGKTEVDSCLCTIGGSNRAAGCTVAIFEDVISLCVPRNSHEVRVMLVNDENGSVLAECAVPTESMLKEQRTMMFDMVMKNQGRK